MCWYALPLIPGMAGVDAGLGVWDATPVAELLLIVLIGTTGYSLST